MRLILSASRRDIHLALLQADRIAKLGGVGHVRALLVTAPDLPAGDAECLAKRLRPSFAALQQVTPERVREQGWPVACNDMFVGGCRALYDSGNREPFYFMEPDCAPMREGWFSDLAAEYASAKKAGKLYLGVVTPTRFRDKAGNEVHEGSHMVGTGVYPPGFPFDFTALWRYLGPVPWDIYFRHTMIRHVRHTDLIQHNWGTHLYWRNPFGTILCEKADENGTAQAVREGVAVLHGCKDGSVYRCLEGCNIPAYTNPAPIPQPERKPRKRRK